MVFDSTVTFTTLVNLAVFIVGGIVVVATLRAEMRGTTNRLSKLEDLMSIMERSMAVLAVQEDRLNAFSRRLERIEGWLLHVDKPEG